ncbi:Uncharacterised protein [Mycobacterium tuberculosis]|nr:Uncharacterised protein [Mycobacterium tuberculosis]
MRLFRLARRTNSGAASSGSSSAATKRRKAASDSSIRLARAKRSWAWSTAADNTNPDRLWPVSAAAWRRACSCSGDRRKLRRPVRVSGMYVM